MAPPPEELTDSPLSRPRRGAVSTSESRDAVKAALAKNRLLAALDAKSRDLLATDFELITLKPREQIYDVDSRVTAVYFPISAVVSAVLGSTVLVSIGNEGMLGVPLMLGVERSFSRIVVQVGGRALRMDAARFRINLEQSPALGRVLAKYIYVVLKEILQDSLCRRAHAIEPRCARWLLRMCDWVAAEDFRLTQQFLSEMMDVRRATVNPALGVLRKASLIHYVRGRIRVLDRAGLEAAACDCYRIVDTEYRRLNSASGG
jgi:CRP-like cAMP-binding protein